MKSWILKLASITCLVVVISLVCYPLLEHPSGAVATHCDSPTQVVKTAIDQVLEAIKKYPCNNKEDGNCSAFKEKLHEIAVTFIDFDQVSKLALGRYRRRFHKDEMEEFKRLFQALLENTYMRKLQDYSGEKIIFEHERRLNEYKVQVDTKVITSSNTIPVSYRLFKKNGEWKVYDILVEGVSLLKNYRQQFSNILRSKKPGYLIKLLKKKLETLNESG